MQLLAEIPGSARSFEWTPLFIGTPANGADQFFRVVAVDDLGQEGIADLSANITDPTPFTGSMVATSPAAGTYRPGDSLTTCATVTPVVGSTLASIELDNDDTGFSLGGVFVSGNLGCTVLPAQVPDVSTDRARVRYDATGALNQVKSFYGPYFSIRPDPILGDAAPGVSLTSTHTGASYPGGTVIPIAWTASDDEGLRSFDIRASFNGGTRWLIVARDLPAAARSYGWRLPGSWGIPSVKLRVVARDKRFQNTSTESGMFAITAGLVAPACPADVNGDNAINTADLVVFLGLFGQTVIPGSPADLNNDGVVNTADLVAFLGRFGQSCP